MGMGRAGLSKLEPTLLFFWFGTQGADDGRLMEIGHLSMFLGHENEDERAVMGIATN